MKLATAAAAQTIAALGMCQGKGIPVKKCTDCCIDNSGTFTCHACPCDCAFGSVSQSGEITPATGRRRKLEEDAAAGLTGNVVLGNDADNGIFVATNATNFPNGVTNGTLTVAAVADSEGECNSNARGRALEFPLEKAVTYEINSLGGIESDGNWFQQSIRELQGNSTLPVSLTELVNGGGSESEYRLAVYLLSSDEELLGCASMKKLDDVDVDEAAEYYAVLFPGLSQDQEAIKKAPSSGSKIGLLVSVFAIAGVGIAVWLGNVLAL